MTADAINAWLFLIPLLPLAGAALNGLAGHGLGPRLVRLIACGSVLCSFIISAAGLLALLSVPADTRVIIQAPYQWLAIVGSWGGLNLDMAFRLDPLSAVMCLVVTGVGFLIHLYSVGYMAHDDSQPRYFAYLNLFTFSMLLLVLADNLLLMFVGWEGVGLCSYLLIGFWFTDLEKAQAGMKAFLVNRVGDLGFFLGLLLLFATLNQAGPPTGVSLAYDDLRAAVPALLAADPVAGLPALTWVTLLFFLGACGKSAQIPLYVWLPDAMAGPTPVSALIHAATMVTAGVFMIARTSFLYAAAPITLSVVAMAGALTALLAALFALAQNDIKKVLAYSTISQLGYMFLAVGVSAFHSAVFHLITHAFFKALLFLAAGSVIHAVGHNDLRRMGGLSRHLPITYLTFLAGYLAICGLPPLSGFFSKDEILQAAFTSHLAIPGLGPLLGALGLMVAGLTALYMTRLLLLTFAGSFRGEREAGQPLHESVPVMTWPLMALALLSLLGGGLGLPAFLGLPHLVGDFLAPVWPATSGAGQAAHSTAAEILLMGVSTATALAGILVGWWLCLASPRSAQALVERFAGLHRALLATFHVDEFYRAVFVGPLLSLVRFCGRFDNRAIDGPILLSSRFTTGVSSLVGWGDLNLLDGLINYLADLFNGWGRAMGRMQTGLVDQYLYSVVCSLLLLYLLNLLL